MAKLRIQDLIAAAQGGPADDSIAEVIVEPAVLKNPGSRKRVQVTVTTVDGSSRSEVVTNHSSVRGPRSATVHIVDSKGLKITAATGPFQAPLAQERTAFLSSVLGAAGLARLLGVSRSQPTRWRNGDELPGAVSARRLVDLEHVMSRALMLYPQRVALDWLTSANSYLDGARPVDVLQTRGSAEVIEALDAAAADVFA